MRLLCPWVTILLPSRLLAKGGLFISRPHYGIFWPKSQNFTQACLLSASTASP